MGDLLSLLATIDHWCTDVAAALQHAEWQIYPALALGLTMAYFTAPPRQDPD